ncbi:MAG: ATP synthase F0 subunit B [Desulfosoma sp.]
MISLNATIVVQVTLFLVLLFILNRMMIQPLYRLVLERERSIEEKEKALESAGVELEKMAAAYNARLQAAEWEARKASEAAKAEAQEEAHRTMLTTQEEITALRQKVRAEVEVELGKARKSLQKLARALSYEISTKVVGRKI